MPAAQGRPRPGGGVSRPLPPLPLPGRGCRFWAAGRCLYEERLNPGLHAGFACTALQALADSFDAFVVRGESLGLSSEEAGRIWERRVDAALNIGLDCANFIPLPDEAGDVPCAHFLDGVCLLRMPVCPGRCRRFVAGF